MGDGRHPAGYIPLTSHTLNGGNGNRQESRGREYSNGRNDSRGDSRGSGSRTERSVPDRRGPSRRGQSGGEARSRPMGRPMGRHGGAAGGGGDNPRYDNERPEPVKVRGNEELPGSDDDEE